MTSKTKPKAKPDPLVEAAKAESARLKKPATIADVEAATKPIKATVDRLTATVARDHYRDLYPHQLEVYADAVRYGLGVGYGRSSASEILQRQQEASYHRGYDRGYRDRKAEDYYYGGYDGRVRGRSYSHDASIERYLGSPHAARARLEELTRETDRLANELRETWAGRMFAGLTSHQILTLKSDNTALLGQIERQQQTIAGHVKEGEEATATVKAQAEKIVRLEAQLAEARKPSGIGADYAARGRQVAALTTELSQIRHRITASKTLKPEYGNWLLTGEQY